jgi:hypothetical protein
MVTDDEAFRVRGCLGGDSAIAELRQPETVGPLQIALLSSTNHGQRIASLTVVECVLSAHEQSYMM